MSNLDKIPNWLMKRAYLTPNRTAISFDDKNISFKELLEKTESMAKKLHSIGIKKGDRVAVLLKNHIEIVVILHALQLLGCQAVLLNIRLHEKELLFQIKDSESTYLISEEDVIFHFSNIQEQLVKSIIIMDRLQNLIESDFDYVTEFDLNEICTMMYTSGTTGHPKGVLQTYGNHWSSAIGSALNLGIKENDAWLTAVPLFHISGFSTLVRSVVYGIPIILFEKFDEVKINQALIEGKATIMSIVTSMLQRMIAKLGNNNYHPSFRCFLLGGGPVPVSMLQVCKDKNIPVFQTYGMTETSSQIVTLSPGDSLRKTGSAGKPLFLSQVRIVNEGTNAAPNEIGEIVVKGPNVTNGYYKRDEANQNNFTSDGWFFTGDAGYLDEEGFLFVLDRRSDLIISGGENIYPAEVENVITSHPGVLEAAVVGMSDEKWGQVPCAFYVEKEGRRVSEDELTKLCFDQLAKYKVPKKWIQTEDLPKTASNKIKRKTLREYLER